MRRGEVWVLAALVLLGLYVVYTGVAAIGMINEQGGISAGVLPTIAGSGLGIVSLLILLRRSPAPAEEAPPTDGYLRVKRWLVFAILVAAVALVTIFGFALTMGVVTYALLAWVERVGQLKSVLCGAVLAVVVWLVFDVFIGVPLPEGVVWPG